MRRRTFPVFTARSKNSGQRLSLGEFLSKKDEQNLMDYWCKQDNLKRLETTNPQDYDLKVDLAHAYYLNEDVSNGHYQYWLVLSRLQKTPDQELESYVEKVLRPQIGCNWQKYEETENIGVCSYRLHDDAGNWHPGIDPFGLSGLQSEFVCSCCGIT